MHNDQTQVSRIGMWLMFVHRVHTVIQLAQERIRNLRKEVEQYRVLSRRDDKLTRRLRCILLQAVSQPGRSLMVLGNWMAHMDCAAIFDQGSHEAI